MALLFNRSDIDRRSISMSPSRPAYKAIFMIIVFGQGVLTGAQAQGDKDIRPLERVKAIEREIAGGETHT